MSTTPDAFLNVLRHFGCESDLELIETQTQGHINRSYRITMRDTQGRQSYFLQRLNTAIFKKPRQVMENIDRVTRHLSEKLAQSGAADPDRKILSFYHSAEGRPFIIDEFGDYWRLCRFIERSHSRLTPSSAEQVACVAHEFGRFHTLVSDLPEPRLHETLPNFHDTPLRLQQFRASVQADIAGRVESAADLIATAERYADLASRLEALRDQSVPERIVHNDAKISNILLDDNTDQPLCVVDLDTVMPGLTLYDFGDMVRTLATRAGEDEVDLDQVVIEPEWYAALAEGYLSATGDLLTSTERESLVIAGQVISYEQGLRFLTDYLQADHYYQTKHPEHNLVRAKAQFALLDDLHRRAKDLAKTI
jgi:serine/threonine protein kinase